MSEVLYRKYRPQKFEDIVGEGHVVKVLRASVERERISHAYLFSGPRGTGKTSAARIFARAINCLNSDTAKRPDNTCEICNEFLSAIALDLVEIDAASSRGIDEIRAVKEAVEPLPFKSRYKVYIIDEVHPDLIVLGHDQSALEESLREWMQEHHRYVPIQRMKKIEKK